MGEDGGKGADSAQNVKVALRMRPPSNKEKAAGEKCIVDLAESKDGPGKVTLSDPDEKEKPAEFAFDIVFGISGQQEDVFDQVGAPALEATLKGYNGTIFAYGQTGSGKSWCMMGGPEELRGIIPRVNQKLFDRLQEEQVEYPTRRYLVTCSFFEIYNEIIFDLLNPVGDKNKMGAGLQVKEHPILGIYVKDLMEMVVDNGDKLVSLMNSGTKNRAVSSTMMNSVSSRSHSIFIIKVHQKDDEDKSKNVFAKLNLVDLAGSERQKGTGATGQTLKEGANINKSLSALGNVINALVETANGKKVFVPFRNSKLTRVLQESLGGNSLCTMLATLSPAACNYEETMSTLRYANRAKAIKVSATKNEEASQISKLNAEVEELKKKLASQAAGGGGGGSGGLIANEERAEIKAKFEAQLKEMEQLMSQTWEQKAKHSADQESEVGKALEELKRQERAMEEECRRKFRMLQDQDDLELSIKSLLDTLQSLPSKADATAAEDANAGPQPPADSPGRMSELRSGDVPKQWLKSAASISEAHDSLKQHHTMAKIFQGAFSEDLRLWVDGEEASDNAMARAGARRARAKLETLRKECDRLAATEAKGKAIAEEFASVVAQVANQWLEAGASCVLKELREATALDQYAPEGEAGVEKAVEEAKTDEDSVPPMYRQAVQEIGKVLRLIEEQGRARASEFGNLASLEVRSMAELLLRGVTLTPGHNLDPADLNLLRSLAEETPAEPAPPPVASDPAAPAIPREQRPLHEWTPEDADGSAEGTEHALVQLVELDTLNKKRTPQELLARPPPKFVHDVALLVRQATGFLHSMSEDWPDPREAKLELLQYISDTVRDSLGMTQLDFDPADVLKGKEVTKTLRLLTLMAIGASRERQGGGASPKVHGDQKRDEGMAPASQMPPLLEALVRCIDMAVARQQEQQKERPGSGHASPTRELESSHRALQGQLEEEMQVRKRQEDRLAQLQQELSSTRMVLEERSAQLDEVQQVASDFENRKEELRKQVDALRSGLLSRAKSCETANVAVADIRKELEETAASLNTKSQEKLRLAGDVKRLQQKQLETDTEKETMEMEVKRMRLRAAEGLVDNNAVKNSPVAEELIDLQAEKQKLDVQVAALEEKSQKLGEEDDAERQRENAILEDLQLKNEGENDQEMELQVIVEERDALREGMDNLYGDKIRCNEELENISMSYTHLSDRLVEKTMETRELQEQLDQYENLLSMLQENYEKNRQSPVPPRSAYAPAAAAPPSAPPGPMPPPAPQANGVGPHPPPAPGPPPAPAAPLPPGAAPLPGPSLPPEEDNGSSHYSDDDFEEPDPDEAE